MKNVIITDFRNINKTDWSDFVYSHPYGNVFQTPEMYDLYSTSKKNEPFIVAVVNSKEEIHGLLISVIQKEHTGFLGKFSSRSIIIGGPLVRDDSSDVIDFILKAYTRKIKGRAIYSQFRNLWRWSDEQVGIFKKKGYDYEAHLDIFFDLNKSVDGLLMEMHKGRRKNIRRAERLPLRFSEIENDSEYEKCIKLIQQTYKRVKLPCPDISYFTSAREILSKNDRLKTFTAKYKGEIIACRFVLCYKNLIYDWYAGANDDHLDKYPNDFLPWKVMEWGIDHGYETFDFGGAGKPGIPYGVRDHKMKFGGNLVEFGRFESVHSFLLYRIGIMGLKIYKKIK